MEAPAVAEAEAADNEVAIDNHGKRPGRGRGRRSRGGRERGVGGRPRRALRRQRGRQLGGPLDLGALWVVGLPGMELRLEVEETTQNVVGATAVLGDSAVQLQAFAAPKSMGIWDDIRAEIAESIVAQGGTADETRGRARHGAAHPHALRRPRRAHGLRPGPVRRGRRPALVPQGRLLRPRRHRRGRRADPDAGRPWHRGRARGRGDGPPRAAAAASSEEVAASEAEDDESEAGASSDDLKPFERGPEITEVR